MDDELSIASAALTSATCYPRHSSRRSTKSPASQCTTDPRDGRANGRAFADAPAARVTGGHRLLKGGDVGSRPGRLAHYVGALMIIDHGVKYPRALPGDQDRAVADNRYLGFSRIVLAAFCRHVMISRLKLTPAADGSATVKPTNAKSGEP